MFRPKPPKKSVAIIWQNQLVAPGLGDAGGLALELQAVQVDDDALANSLPEFMNSKLFGKTILVVNKRFGHFLGRPLSQ